MLVYLYRMETYESIFSCLIPCYAVCEYRNGWNKTNRDYIDLDSCVLKHLCSLAQAYPSSMTMPQLYDLFFQRLCILQVMMTLMGTSITCAVL